MGCIAGRYANRIANGMFTIDGTTYAVTVNLGMNCLHGGFKGLAKRMWFGDMGVTPEGPAVRLTILDRDGEEGFPGNLNITVIYTLTNDNTLKVQYYATTDKATPINLTHHSYFNLAGKGDVLGYVAKIYADHYLSVDQSLIPTGDITPVAGTPFDFTKPKADWPRHRFPAFAFDGLRSHDGSWQSQGRPGQSRRHLRSRFGPASGMLHDRAVRPFFHRE